MRFLTPGQIRILLSPAAIGPGFIPANVDHEVGGILKRFRAAPQLSQIPVLCGRDR